MANEISQSVIDDIFQIARDGSNISEEEDDDFGLKDSNSGVLFDDKVAGVADDVASLPPVPVAPTVVTQMVTLLTDVNKAINMATPEEKKDFDSLVKKADEVVAKAKTNKLFGDLFEDEPKAPEIKAEVPKIVGEIEKDKPTEMPKNIELNGPVSTTVAPDVKVESVVSDNIANSQSGLSTAPVQLTPGGHRWKLESPSPMYKRLYEEKKRLLSDDLLKGGELPFDKFREELENANVDTNVPTYDTEEVGRRISEVQKWRDRVKFIQLKVNAQWFAWKSVMDLLPGFLARIEYERGKQEGIQYEHLYDFTSYLAKLEDAYKSCDMVSKHLDGAYNSLSRQVAIQQPFQEVERYTTSQSKMAPEMLHKYDGLKTHANKVSGGDSKPAKADPSSGWGHVT